MNSPPNELQKLMQHVDQLIAQAPDEATRLDLQRLRARLDSPEMVDLAREMSGHRTEDPARLVLEFHDPLLPATATATGCVIAAIVCLSALIDGFQHANPWVPGADITLWVVAIFAGACSALFTALSFVRTFSVRFDTQGMVSRSAGKRWQRLQVGAMSWKDIRSLRERVEDRVLEIRAAGNKIFEVPMRLANYPILREHLENMVRLYGDRVAG
jgi:hypothetical protein